MLFIYFDVMKISKFLFSEIMLFKIDLFWLKYSLKIIYDFINIDINFGDCVKSENKLLFCNVLYINCSIWANNKRFWVYSWFNISKLFSFIISFKVLNSFIEIISVNI